MTERNSPGESRDQKRPRPSGAARGRVGSGRPGGEKRGERPRPERGRRFEGEASARREKRSPRPPKSSDAVADEKVYPAIDADVEPKMLDRFARRELAALDKEPAEFVANHLVMAARLIDDDPARAHQHALAALDRGSRIPVVRETVGITGYLCGDFALALRELRTHRRLTGSDDNVPMMIDCERGLGRPEKGIEFATTVNRSALTPRVRVELAIALSGARLDRGETDRALLELELPELTPHRVFDYSPDLFDAYAVVLAELGREDEASLWGKRANQAAIALQEHALGDELVITDALSNEDD